VQSAFYRLTFPKIPADVPPIVQAVRIFKVEPELFLSDAEVRLGEECSCVPSKEHLVIKLRGIAGDHNAAGYSFNLCEQLDVIAFDIVITVDASASARTRKIGWITIDQFVANKLPRREEIYCVCLDIGGRLREKTLPIPDN
jgi:hypothetical protein